MWVGQNCHHVADQPFGNELGKVMKEKAIVSVVDLGCGQGQYIKQLSLALGNEKT